MLKYSLAKQRNRFEKNLMKTKTKCKSNSVHQVDHEFKIAQLCIGMFNMLCHEKDRSILLHFPYHIRNNAKRQHAILEIRSYIIFHSHNNSDTLT